MKNIFKRIIAVMLVLVITIGSAPLSGFVGFDWLDLKNLFTIQAEAATYSGTCGDDLTWTLDVNTGLLEILGNGSMYDFEYGASPWYEHRSNITKLKINNGISKIGNCSFTHCDMLTDASIPSTVLSIGNHAFNGCLKLKAIYLPSKLKNIGDYSFSYCGFTNIIIPDSVSDIGNTSFFRCDNLISIEVAENNDYYSNDGNGVLFNKYKTSLIKYPDGSTLTEYIIPDTVTTIEDAAFYGCNNLESLFVSENVKQFGSDVFLECDNLKNIIVDDNNNSFSSDEKGALYDKHKTTLVKVPDYTSTTYFVVPESVTKIDNYAFYYCRTITNIVIPKSVNSIGGYVFVGCERLTEIKVDINNAYFSNDSYGVLYNKNKSMLINYPDGNNSVSYYIPEGVTQIGFFAFYECENLAKISIPSSVKYIDELSFVKCRKLSNIIVDSSNEFYLNDENGVLFDKSKSELIKYPIGKSETDYIIPDGVKTICSNSFSSCDNLVTITLADSVTNISSNAFNSCNSLKSIVISDSLTTIGDYAFSHSDSINDVYYTGTKLQWEEIKIGDDNDCLINATIHFNCIVGDELKLNQESITISNNVCPTIYVTEYPKGVFADSLVWSSSNDGVAYVNEDNVVTPVHYGKTDITVSTADGKYSATCEVTVEASFVITSESSNVKSIRCGDTAKYRIYFLNYKAEELPVDDVTSTITENGVLEVLSCNKYDKYIELEVKAVSEGAEVIEVESDEPLAYNKFKISVYPENVDWRADKVPNYGKANIENFIRSTFVVENYSYVYNENDSTYTVTMDVYNMAGDYPVLAAYNSFGELVDFDAADRFVAMPGDWIDFFGTLGFGAVQMMNGDMFTYRSVTRSKKSTISVEVPADGYITISNDITVCPVAAIYNISGLLVEAVSVSCGFSNDEADKNNDITKEFVKSLKNKVPGFKETLNKLIEEFLKNSAKKVSSDYLVSILLFSKDAIYELCEDAGSSFEEIAGDVILSVLDKDIQDFISKTAMETLIEKELVEAVALSKLKAADKYFTAGKVLGLADFAFHVAAFNTGSGLTTIQFNPCGENGFVCKDTIKITSTIIDEDTLLHHFVIMDPNKKTLAKEELKINFNDIVEVHEIALIKNGKKVEDVMFRATVEMDIPKNMFGPSVKVFRIEKDGTYTQLETTIMNGKVVFTTDHFSEYILTGRSIDDVVAGVALNTDTYEIINKQTYQLEAMVSPDTASNKNVVWSSDNEEVATVDENGLVTANSLGTAIITATTVDGGYSASCKVTVLPREFTVTWNIDGVETPTTVSEGSAIIKPENPTKDGYKFMGWTPAVPGAMPAYDMTFTAVFEKSYICPECGNEILGEDAIYEHIVSETKVTIIGGTLVNGELKPGATIIIKAEEIDGKIFSHWIVEGATVEDSNSAETTFVLGSGKISITAEYDNCDCKCHQGGIAGFFFKIVLFFQKLFGNNLECICGAKH